MTTAPAGYGLTVTTAPAAEPVSPADAKTHLRVEHAADDALIARLVAAARRLTEAYTGRRWVSQTVTVTYPDFPRAGAGGGAWGQAVRLPVEPVRSVSSVSYTDTAGTLQTLAASAYQTALDRSPPLVAPARNTVWPAADAGTLAAVRVAVVAGYGGAADVPEDAKAAVLLCVGAWYANRGDGADPEKTGLPPAAKRLLDLLHTGRYD